MAPFSAMIKKAWDTTFRDAKSFWLTFTLMGIFGLVLNLAIFIGELQSVNIQDFFSRHMEWVLENIPVALLVGLVGIWAGIVIFVLSLYTNFLGHKVITQNAQNKKATFSHIISDSKDFGAYIGTGILQFLIGIGIGLCFGVVFAIGAVIYNALAYVTNGWIVFDIIGIVILVLLGILFIAVLAYITTIFIFTFAAFFVDHVKYTQALKKSYSLVGGRWWQTFGYMIILSIAMMVISAAIGFANSISIFFSWVAEISIAMIGVIIQTASQTIISMFWFAFILALYDEYKKHPIKGTAQD